MAFPQWGRAWWTTESPARYRFERLGKGLGLETRPKHAVYANIADLSGVNTPFFPKVARHYDVTSSTNAEAVAAVSGEAPPPPGAVFLTEAQTAGRGQGTNAWHATAGDNLTLSVVAYPDHLAAQRLFVLNQYVSLAVAATVRRHLPPGPAAGVRVKWPNDVYVGDQKIAGVLIQNGLRGSTVGWSVIGVGLNVNETDFPPALRRTATSLAILNGRAVDRAAVLQTLFGELTDLYALTAGPGQKLLAKRYHTELYRRDEVATYRETAGGPPFAAIFRRVDDHGRAVLSVNGRERTYALREVAFG